ncbi:MAG: hypothetical protein LBC61_06740 [Candidatus Peribacteria bacterium]|nr:hypothetical protein [Candidatus Peribacteria bacterium]
MKDEEVIVLKESAKEISLVKKVEIKIKVVKEPAKEISLIRKAEKEAPILIDKPKSSTSIKIQKSKTEAIKIGFGKRNELIVIDKIKNIKVLEITPKNIISRKLVFEERELNKISGENVFYVNETED